MSVQLNPVSKSAAAATASTGESEPLAPLGMGDGTSSIESMAVPKEDSGSCLWDMVVSFWNWLTNLCCFCSTVDPELLLENFEEKSEEILTKHLSDSNLSLINHSGTWQIGIVSKVDGQTLFTNAKLSYGDAAAFRENVVDSVKKQLGSNPLSKDSQLSVETIWMTKSFEKMHFVRLLDCVDCVNAKMFHLKSDTSAQYGLTEEEAKKYLGAFPAEFSSFFL